MYLTLFRLFCYSHLFIYVNILLFYWVYFTSYFDHYIEQNLLLLIKKQPLGDLLQNSCSRSGLNQLKYACESVLFLLKVAGYKPSTLLKSDFFTVVFFKGFNRTTSLMLNSYSEESLFLQNTFLIGCCAFIKFE